jgi:hypothetical protein
MRSKMDGSGVNDTLTDTEIYRWIANFKQRLEEICEKFLKIDNFCDPDFNETDWNLIKLKATDPIEQNWRNFHFKFKSKFA